MQPFPTRNARVLSTLDFAEVVAQRHVDGIAQLEVQNLATCWTAAPKVGAWLVCAQTPKGVVSTSSSALARGSPRKRCRRRRWFIGIASIANHPWLQHRRPDRIPMVEVRVAYEDRA